MRNKILAIFVLLLLGMAVFLLPIRETDYARLRYIVGVSFFAEAAFQLVPAENRTTPLYLLVGRYRSWRDKVVAGLALAAMFVALYWAVRLVLEHFVSWPVWLALSIGCGLGAWGLYYAICVLLGTKELRRAVTPGFLRKKKPPEDGGSEGSAGGQD